MGSKLEDIKELTKRFNTNQKTFFDSYVPREERHYCAHLFSYFINSTDMKAQIRNFFELCDYPNPYKNSKLASLDFTKVKIFYEFTALRDLIHLIDKNPREDSLKEALIGRLENYIFEKRRNNPKKGESRGDITKKKPDLAFYLPNEGRLILIEAKFEKGFNYTQFNETERYTEALQMLFPDFIKNEPITVALGRKFYLNTAKEKHHWLAQYPRISWDRLAEQFSKIPNEDANALATTINQGLKEIYKYHEE